MPLIPPCKFNVRAVLPLIAAGAALLSNRAAAASYTLTANDAVGTSSFNAAGNWSSGAAPTAGNTYATGAFQVRGPANATSYTFGGDSLTVNTGGRFLLKTTGNSQVLTINNLILAGGIMDQATTNNDGFAVTVAGNLNVASNSAVGALLGETLTISARMTGNGMLQIAGSNVNAGGDNGTLIFNGLNNGAFTGGMMMSGTGILTLGADLAGGTGNFTLASGTLRLTGGSTNNYLADGATLALANGSVANLAYNGADTVSSLVLGGVAQAPGTYSAVTNPTFFSGTGSITVVPEPSTLANLALGTVGLLGAFGWKRKRRAGTAAGGQA